MKTIFLLPGQGTQYPGMAKDLFDELKEVRELFEFASHVENRDLKKVIFESDQEELNKTNNSQIAIVLTSLSVNILMKNEGIKADYLAGFSLGEYSALAISEVLELDKLFELLKKRAELMNQASKDNPGSMFAVLGLDIEQIKDILHNAEGIYIANHNAHKQIVLSVSQNSLEKFNEIFKKIKHIPLKVNGAFHSPLMQEASNKFREFIIENNLNFANFKIPCFSNVDANIINQSSLLKKLLPLQITSTVKWLDIETNIKKLDEELNIFEIGPGSVLTKLFNSFDRKIKCSFISSIKDRVKI